MSGVEVVAAVSAVVSAFHAGSELLKHIKAKRRKVRMQAQQEFEEKQLQDSLISGEQQIGFRYAQDMKEMGDLVRVGDSIARDRLLHIAVMLQMEIIKSLQMAAKHERAILNLQILHEASIMNRKETFVTLDEMKQRIIMTRPMVRQIEDMSGQGSSIATLPPSRSSTFDPVSAVPEGYVPSAVTLAPQVESKEQRSGISRYIPMKRNSSISTGSASTSASTPTKEPNINYSAALEDLVKARREDRATIMKDIDDILVSYKGLDLGNKSLDEPWGLSQLPKPAEKPNASTVLNSDETPSHDEITQNWNHLTVGTYARPQSQVYTAPRVQSQPTFNQDVFNGHQQYPSCAASNPYPHYQAQVSHRFSDSSSSSAPFSDRSWEHNDSVSSHSSYATSEARYSVQPTTLNMQGLLTAVSTSTAPHQSYDQYSQGLSIPTPRAPTNDMYTSPVAPLTVPQRNPLRASPQNGGPSGGPSASHEITNSPIQSPLGPGQQRTARIPDSIAPFASPPDSPMHQDDDRTGTSPSRPNMSSLEIQGSSSSHSSSSGHTVITGLPSTPWHRAMSVPATNRFRQPSIASTDSSGSGSVNFIPRPPIGSATIQSPKLGQERMMGGRPCKDNNYWGFCKGSWDVREDPKKGLVLRTMPSGMYNTKEIWECKHCNFRGSTYVVTYSGKKSPKKEIIVDPNIHTSKSGIRYRWIFIAKSHVKKKTSDSANEECNYGCVICSVEKKATSVFGNVETLMFHLLEHVSEMTQHTMQQARVIVGRTAGLEEDWDINIPLFLDISEMKG